MWNYEIAVLGRGKEENDVKMPIEKYTQGSELYPKIAARI